MELGSQAMQMVWIGALAAPPLALVVGAACVIGRCRPATKHALWTAALVSFVVPAVAGVVWRVDWFQTSRLAGVGVEPAGMTGPAAEPTAAVAAADEGVGSESVVVERGEVESPLVESARADGGLATPVVEETAGGDGVAESVWSGLPAGLESGAVLARSDESESEACVEVDSAAIAEAPTAPVAPRVSHWIDSAERESSGAVAPPGETATTEPGVTPGLLGVGVGAAETGTTVVGVWLAQGLVVRDAIAGMPPIPSAVWLGGAVLMMVMMCLRSVTLYRVVRRGVRADEAVLDVVRQSASEIGLGRVPETVMVRERVSPMIWCGISPKLVLPEELWGELDEASRRAVICHELAHLKRRDHWLCWVEAMVRVLYWWHPVAWWVCRRVREEADASCDVWVTSLMPRCRRAYAEALIATKSYLNVPGRRVPVGLGVMSNRSKRLARRLTMVMTQKSRPKVSALGTCLALGVLAAGVFVMPGLACPPDEQAKSASGTKARVAKVVTSAGQVPVVVSLGVTSGVGAQGECEVTCETTCEEEGLSAAVGAGVPEVAFFGEAPALEAMMGGAGGDEAAMRRLEERLRRLEEQLRRLEGQRRSGTGTGAAGTMPSVNTTRAPIARYPGGTGAGGAAATEHALLAETMRRSTADALRGAMNAEAVAKTYQEQQRAFATIAPVQADEAYRSAIQDNNLFGAQHGSGHGAGSDPFVISTDGETHTQEYRLPEGKLRAMIALMERDDVPVFIDRHPDKIVVHGTDSQHRVFRAFVALINPDSTKVGSAGAPGGRGGRALAAPRSENARRADELKAKADQIRGQHREMERRAKETEKKADKTRTKAEKLGSQAESLNERADEMAERAEAENNEARKQQLLAQAEALRAQAAVMEAQAGEVESQADAIESEADALGQAADELEDALDDIEDAMDDDTEVGTGAGSMPGMGAASMSPTPGAGAFAGPSRTPGPASVDWSRGFPTIAPPTPPVPAIAPVAPVAPIPPVAPVAPAAR